MALFSRVSQAIFLSNAGLRKTRDFDVAVAFNAQTVINPTIDVPKRVRDASELYLEMLYENDPKKQFEKMRNDEMRVLADQVHFPPAFWWYKINPHHAYVRGCKSAPSHYLNQALDSVWIDAKLG